ncbi:hypothetical protein [Pedobacter roseus]|uniref:Uncharacterized protein n=1 Tax=Pedobacter roseus TaxID=336820 RepID=A0A7G9QE57_9SPHI|nr:hypothetical protein [Pedobacter roseus]QNN41632.1 hypothetical protein H9L23_21405 [Pedobacter roseus]
MNREIMGIKKEIKNQNQKFLPVLFAKKPARSCGDNNSPSMIDPRIISGI